MSTSPSPREEFGPLEAEVMDAIWSHSEPVAVRRVVDELNAERSGDLAYTTVMTVMGRLAEKGVLTRSKVGRGYLYKASAPDAAGLAVKGVLRTYGDAAVAHFVNEAEADPAVLKKLRRMLDEADG
jgi:predicted transcriptional regulator